MQATHHIVVFALFDTFVIVPLGNALHLARQPVERMDGVGHSDTAVQKDEQQTEDDEWADDEVQAVISLKDIQRPVIQLS